MPVNGCFCGDRNPPGHICLCHASSQNGGCQVTSSQVQGKYLSNGYFIHLPCKNDKNRRNNKKAYTAKSTWKALDGRHQNLLTDVLWRGTVTVQSTAVSRNYDAWLPGLTAGLCHPLVMWNWTQSMCVVVLTSTEGPQWLLKIKIRSININ